MSEFRYPHRLEVLLRERGMDDLIPLLEDRDRALEDFLANFEGGGAGGPSELNFSLAGNLRVVEWPRQYIHEDQTIRAVHVSLDTPGITDTTVELFRNSLGMDTIDVTLLAGENYKAATTNLPYELNAGDYIQARVVTRGTTARDLNIQAIRTIP